MGLIAYVSRHALAVLIRMRGDHRPRTVTGPGGPAEPRARAAA
jgi:hypothetical protein